MSYLKRHLLHSVLSQGALELVCHLSLINHYSSQANLLSICRWMNQQTWDSLVQQQTSRRNRKTDRLPDSCAEHSDDMLLLEQNQLLFTGHPIHHAQHCRMTFVSVFSLSIPMNPCQVLLML